MSPNACPVLCIPYQQLNGPAASPTAPGSPGQRYPRKPWDALKTHERILQKIQMDNPELNSLHLPLNITMKPGWVHKLDCCASPEYLQCIQMSADADQGKKNASLEKPISQVYQKELLCNIYKTLFEHDIITQLDLDICSAWLSHF